jgi:putative hydrolase of the HAD superfamily
MRTLFFDLDHTLWDFEKNSREALTEGYEVLNLAAEGVGELNEYIKVYEAANDWCWGEYRAGRLQKEQLRGMRFSLAMKPWGLSDNKELGERLGTHYIETSPFKTNMIDGTVDVLEELHSRGHRMLILTNGFEEVQHLKVERCGLGKFFDEVYTSDFLGYKKPHPQIFQLALEKSGESLEDVTMLGDSLEADIIGAREAGWGQVYFNPKGTPHTEKVQHEVKTLVEILDIVLN